MSKSNGHESVYDASDWDILKYVHKMLADGNVLNTTGDKPVVSFKYPDELQVRLVQRAHRVQIRAMSQLKLTNLMFRKPYNSECIAKTKNRIKWNSISAFGVQLNMEHSLRAGFVPKIDCNNNERNRARARSECNWILIWANCQFDKVHSTWPQFCLEIQMQSSDYPRTTPPGAKLMHRPISN